MEVRDIVVRNLDQMWGVVERVLEGMTPYELAKQPGPESNSVGWIVWHMGRVEDRWMQRIIGDTQLWEEGWAEKMGMPADGMHAGAGMTPEELADFKTPSVEQLKGYVAAVREKTAGLMESFRPERLEDEIDAFGGRKMSIGQVFSHVMSELNQHAGQAAYVKGFLKGYQGRIV
jgi:uncharacterized damage-inducible protein DinB